jgi:hypothetical protein
MRAGRSNTGLIVLLLILGLALMLVGFMAYMHFDYEINEYLQSEIGAAAAFKTFSSEPFINSAENANPYNPYDPRGDALYFYEAPEGFAVISHSQAWNEEKLKLLYHELMMNEHGEEINILYEVVIHPEEDEYGNKLASYTRSTTAVSFFIRFPALPHEFSVDFPRAVGSINIYGGDTNTTVESIAGSLSHEYGHLYTFYHMFDFVIDEHDLIRDTTYAAFRGVSANNLLTDLQIDDEGYSQNRHRCIIEIAAEDYVQLMGSPNTRQVADFVDVRQVIDGAENPTGTFRARNAFPQENMRLPLPNDVPGLEAYFRSYIDLQPRVPIEEKQDVTLQIRQNSKQFNLVTGHRTFIYYTITWNTPYQEAIYTLACYDPNNYNGWGIPIKTVRHGQTASAIIGEYVVERGNQVVSLDDGLAGGVKVFYVVAQLTDGTFFISDKLEYNFG